MKQLSLFGPEEQSVREQVSKEGDGKYRATIAGGWWMAMGKTRAKAIENVVKRRAREIEYFRGCR